LANGKKFGTESLQRSVGGAVRRSGWAGSGELIIDPPQFELGIYFNGQDPNLELVLHWQQVWVAREARGDPSQPQMIYRLSLLVRCS
jgi:hypothetical protein